MPALSPAIDAVIHELLRAATAELHDREGLPDVLLDVRGLLIRLVMNDLPREWDGEKKIHAKAWRMTTEYARQLIKGRIA